MKRLYVAFIALSEFMLLCIGYVLILGGSLPIIVFAPIMRLGMKLANKKTSREAIMRYMKNDKSIE